MIKLTTSILIITIIFWGAKISDYNFICMMWVLAILLNAFTPHVSFMRILLTLEMIVMMIILMVPYQAKTMSVNNMLFYMIMVLSVVDAVMGLSLLVCLSSLKKLTVSSLTI